MKTTLALVALSSEGGFVLDMSSESLVILTNLLVVLASLVLAGTTVRAAAKERKADRKLMRLILRLVGVKDTSGKHLDK